MVGKAGLTTKTIRRDVGRKHIAWPCLVLAANEEEAEYFLQLGGVAVILKL